MVMVFLGIEVNTVLLTITIPREKWEDIQNLLIKWESKINASKKETQSLTGSLNLACKCVCSGRVYLSRILNFLHTLPDNGGRAITQEVKDDVHWWIEFAPKFNGVSLMLANDWCLPNELLSTDSCLTGGGGFSQGDFFHWSFPRYILDLNCNTNQLECLTLVIAIKIWGRKFQRKRILVLCDNTVTVQAINSGASRDKLMQACLRELHVTSALNNCEVRAVYSEGSKNTISDVYQGFIYILNISKCLLI